VERRSSAGAHAAQEPVELTPGQFGGIEVRRVGCLPAHLAVLVRGEVVEHNGLPGRSVGTNACRTKAGVTRASVEPSTARHAVKPPSVRSPRILKRSHEPCGTRAPTHRPRTASP
jgi:hypothetical protein